MKRLVVLLIFLMMVLASIKIGLHIYLDKTINLEAPTMFNVPKGASLGSVTQSLSRQKIIHYPRLFMKVGQLQGYAEKIRYGEYQLKPGDTYQDLFKKVTSGQSYRYEITFVEGDHYYKYARQIEKMGLGSSKKFIELVRNPQLIKSSLGHSAKSLEGYLFPETYHFSKNDGLKTIIKTMVKNFKKKTKGFDFKASGLTRHQAITLASIIEKETGIAGDRPLVASVFHNRLRKKMRLQTDPTILYGMMDKTGKEARNIRKKDILAPTAYNTYVIRGLPPGPISNPGLASIKAALKPAKSNFLYFVSRNDGTTVFSKTYKEHQKAVNKYQRDPKMRKGKSWRQKKSQ